MKRNSNQTGWHRRLACVVAGFLVHSEHRRDACATLSPARIVGLVVLVAALATPALAQVKLKTYETKYYVLHTDLDRNAVLEAESRISAMAEMYNQRTKGFGGRIATKLPFYLFSNPRDYYAAGGMPGSAGVFNGRQMMAIVGRETSDATWHIIQHEGFHQFVYAMIGGDIPIWVNEGMAEYFGQSIYTGDGFVTGLIPPDRLARLKQWIESGKVKSINEMMTTSHELWNAGLSAVNYDQAWSMIHFLAHGDNGRYQDALNNFIKDVSRGMRYEQAWQKNFGAGTREFEKKWRQYWLDMPADATADLYAEATVATVTSFLARAASQRQTFASFSEFSEKAAAGGLKSDEADWLPPKLLKEALAAAEQFGKWEIRKRGGWQVVCTLNDGKKLIGTFKLAGRRVKSESVTVKTGK